MSRMKPMSSMRSASSRMKICTSASDTARCSHRSSRRPGVATRMSQPWRALSICGFSDTPPKIDQRAQVAVLAVVDDALRNLCGELARRREHQRARIASAAGAQLLQQRQRESGGLAGAGLRASEYVAAGENGGNGLGLDGGGNGVALVGHGTEQLGLEPESFK